MICVCCGLLLCPGCGRFLGMYVFARSVGCVVLLVVLLCWLLPGPTFIGEVLSVFFIFLELVQALGPCILWLGSALLEINSYLSKKKKKNLENLQNSSITYCGPRKLPQTHILTYLNFWIIHHGPNLASTR